MKKLVFVSVFALLLIPASSLALQNNARMKGHSFLINPIDLQTSIFKKDLSSEKEATTTSRMLQKSSSIKTEQRMPRYEDDQKESEEAKQSPAIDSFRSCGDNCLKDVPTEIPRVIEKGSDMAIPSPVIMPPRQVQTSPSLKRQSAKVRFLDRKVNKLGQAGTEVQPSFNEVMEVPTVEAIETEMALPEAETEIALPEMTTTGTAVDTNRGAWLQKTLQQVQRRERNLTRQVNRYGRVFQFLKSQ
ncbi:hypothetical protein K9L27_04050 [Candidatus Gracilibacteria bacterium]|nr:hypothetical protein [Candidatus Gracilibacteria bacterium]